MKKLILYFKDHSPPCRAVLITGAIFGLEFDIRVVNTLTMEHLKEDFVKINPQHTIPTLVDGDFTIWESHAIMCYLCNKYGKNDLLYPADPQKRALIDKYLHFDNGVLFSVLRSIVRPLLYFGETKVPQEKLDLVSEGFDFLNTFLEGKTWLVGDNYTIADISCATNVSGLTVSTRYFKVSRETNAKQADGTLIIKVVPKVFRSLDAYPNVVAWLKRCEDNLPYYQKYNTPGNDVLHDIIHEIMDDVSKKNDPV